MDIQTKSGGGTATNRTGRGRRRFVVTAMLLFVLSILMSYASFVAPVAAVHDEGIFELDGNAVDQAAPGDDWENGTPGAAATLFIPGSVEKDGVDTTYFKGGGSKDHHDLSDWAYSATDVAPDKDELLDVFASVYESQAGTIVYFGADKFDDSGDAQIGYWFFQSDISLDGNGGFNGVHTNGDVLVLSDFTNGGAVDRICVYEWNPPGDDSEIDNSIGCDLGNNVTLVAAGAECDVSSPDGAFDVCAVVNSQTETAPWAFTNKDGQHNFQEGQFFEGGINLDQLFGGDAPCFSTFLAETRSSQEVEAQLKDFALGSLDTCVRTLGIVKDDGGATYSAVGDVIPYTITATNTGNVTLHDVIVTDPKAVNLDCTPALPVASLAPGDEINCTAEHVVTQEDLDNGSYLNTACVDDGNGNGAAGADEVCDDEDTPGEQNPALDIVKDDGDATYSAVGDVIHYSIKATNTGNVTLHDVVITDPNAVNLDCTPAVPVADLAPGAEINCTAEHVVTQADLDAGSYLNTACVDDELGDAGKGADEACDDEDTPGSQTPALGIVKTDGDATYSAVGDVIHYNIVATNTGNVTLHDVVVTDPNAVNLDCTPALPVADLAPGDEIHCTAEHVVTQEDLDNGSYLNTACVDDELGQPESGADQACDDEDTPGEQNPALDIVKGDGDATYSAVGDVIHYTIVATNTGNVTLHDVVITDPNAVNLDCTPALPVADLAPAAEINCTAEHTVTQADIDAGSYLNTACVDDELGQPESGADEACDDENTPGGQNPELSIVKDDNGATYDSIGDVINYTIVATNTGNVTLKGVVVTDPNVTDLVCTPATPVDLAPGDSISCTASHTVTQEDLDNGVYLNTACANDTDGPAAEVCDDEDTPGGQNPALAITKDVAEVEFTDVGQVLHYTIVATNVGNVTLHDVVVTDAQVTDLDCTPATPVANLAVGDSITCTATHTTTQEDLDAGFFFNEACADDGTGDGDTGADEVCDDVTTPGQQVKEETPPPTLPNTTTVESHSNNSSPMGGSWLLILVLGGLLASVVVMTPQRSRRRK